MGGTSADGPDSRGSRTRRRRDPPLAARLRRELEVRVGPEYGPFVAILGAVRARLASDPARAAERSRVVSDLLGSPLLELVRAGRRDEVDALLARLAGAECTLERLGVRLRPEG